MGFWGFGQTRSMAIHMSSPDLDESDIRAVVEVMKTGRLSMGPRTKLFEERTGCKVVHDYFNSEEEMLTKLRTNPGAYDVVLINAAFYPDVLAEKLGAMDAMAYTHTCYEGAQPPCGNCAACKLRAKGFAQADVEDPLLIRFTK